MKKLMIMLAAGAMSLAVLAKGVEQISIVENEITTINVPFGITSYLPSNMDVVRIEEVTGTSLRITALRRGRCDLDVRGDKDLAQKYEITVLGDLATTLDTLNTELDQVQEVRARVVGDFIRIDGEVSSIQKWEYLQKVLRNYPNVVRNFAVFSPGPDVMLRLKETLQESGFTVVFQSLGKDRKAWPANQVALVLNKHTQIMQIQGRVYTPEQQAKVRDCLATERWLNVLEPGEKVIAEQKAEDEFRIRGQFDVFFDRPQIRVSVAYMVLTENDVQNLGNSSYRNFLSLDATGLGEVFGSIYHGLDGNVTTAPFNTRGAGNDRHGAQGILGYAGGSLNVTTRFLHEAGINRMSDAGYTVMQSWDKDGASFKSGGVYYVPVSGLNAGDLKSIDYGFTLKTVGGVNPEGDSVDLTVDFANSFLESLTVGPENIGINKKEDFSRQRLSLPLGKTSFIGGVKMIDEHRISPSGLPFLRNVPMLSWFVADSGNQLEDRRLVIMICPEIVDNVKELDLGVDRDINIKVPEAAAKTVEQLEDEKRPFSGGLWNPLNWFAF